MVNDNNSNAFSFLEPYGHFARESKIERYWQKFNGPFSLHRRRTPQFSVYAGMTHYPIEYTMCPFNVKDDLPTDDWIRTNLLSFIRTEFSENKQ